MNRKYIVILTEEEQEVLRRLIQKEKTQGYRIACTNFDEMT